MLVYIGWRIFLDHPVAGAGWQASSTEAHVYGDYLADAKREFPDAPPLAFPSRRRIRTASRTPMSRRSPTSARSASSLLLAHVRSGLFVGGRAALRGTTRDGRGGR